MEFFNVNVEEKLLALSYRSYGGYKGAKKDAKKFAKEVGSKAKRGIGGGYWVVAY